MAEGCRQAALAGEAGRDGNARERLGGRSNQRFREFDSAPVHVCQRRDARRDSEGPREVVHAESGTVRKVAGVQRPLDIGLDEQLHTSERSRRETTALVAPPCPRRRGQPRAKIRGVLFLKLAPGLHEPGD